MPFVTYENCNIAYLANAVNKMYYFANDTKEEFNYQVTGWHFIPNQNYSNWMNQRQWFDLVTNHSSFRLVSCEATVQNMIPLTDNLAIGQDTTFMTFNNTIYALGYTDKHYETFPVESGLDIKYREGIIINPVDGTTTNKFALPLYNHPLYKYNQTECWSVYAWDPFVHPSSLMELRPGKNAITFKWEANPSDKDKFVSTANIYGLNVRSDNTNKANRHISTWNIADMWMTPGQKMKGFPNVIDYNNKQIQIINQEIWNHPINNWFIKMVPIVDSKNNLLKHEAQVVVVRKITFEVQPRVNCTNYPQIDSLWADDKKFVSKEGQPNPVITTRYYQSAYAPANFQGKQPVLDTFDSTDYYTPPTTPSSTRPTSTHSMSTSRIR